MYYSDFEFSEIQYYIGFVIAVSESHVDFAGPSYFG